MGAAELENARVLFARLVLEVGKTEDNKRLLICSSMQMSLLSFLMPPVPCLCCLVWLG